jgi:hypothetical protein
MDQRFLMTHATTLTRRESRQFEPTELTQHLFETLIGLSMQSALSFYAEFFGRAKPALDATLLAAYLDARGEGLDLGLFAAGGIADKEHLSFWCLGQVLQPHHYVESGVFIGSSLHAFLRGVKSSKIVAIDPDLQKLRIPKDMLGGARLVQDKDFSQIEPDIGTEEIGLVYFDDHIDTADRILQATDKGFRYLLVDDSTGFEGICQRLYPAVPTIPMILNAEAFSVGDQLSWSFPRGGDSFIRVTLDWSAALLEKCQQAKRRIRRCVKLPDLGEMLPQVAPTKTIDTSKYLVELQSAS